MFIVPSFFELAASFLSQQKHVASCRVKGKGVAFLCGFL